MISLPEAYERLLQKYGTHTAAAKALGISARRYREYRSDGSVPEPMQKLIRLVATRQQGAQPS